MPDERSMQDGYDFVDGQFIPVQIDAGPKEEIDWNQSLEAAGWFHRETMPERDSDCYQIGVSILSQKDSGPPFLADVWLQDGALTLIRCPTVIDLLRLLRDWIYPLVGYAERELLLNHQRDLFECLTDEENGIPCVRRVRAAERRRREHYRRRAVEAKP